MEIELLFNRKQFFHLYFTVGFIRRVARNCVNKVWMCLLSWRCKTWRYVLYMIFARYIAVTPQNCHIRIYFCDRWMLFRRYREIEYINAHKWRLR